MGLESAVVRDGVCGEVERGRVSGDIVVVLGGGGWVYLHPFRDIVKHSNPHPGGA